MTPPSKNIKRNEMMYQLAVVAIMHLRIAVHQLNTLMDVGSAISSVADEK